MKSILIGVVLMAFCIMLNAQDYASYKVVSTFHILSAGGWDYLAVHGNKLYVSHSTQVNILDKNTGDSLGVIPNTTGVHGIAFDDAINKGFTSNGKLNNISVFDLNTNEITAQYATGKNPDAILYEPFTKAIITCNGGSNDLSVIDPVSGKILATVAVGGKPETAVTDYKGKLFVNIEDKNQIAVVDLKTFTVKQHWSVLPGEEPTGLAIDTATGRLFAGCDKLLVVVNAANGKSVANIPIGEGCDGVAFDNARKTVFTSNGRDGTITVVKETSANNYNVIENAVTKKGARTIAIDETTHTLYVSTADFDPNTPTGSWPKMLPGTFVVLALRR